MHSSTVLCYLIFLLFLTCCSPGNQRWSRLHGGAKVLGGVWFHLITMPTWNREESRVQMTRKNWITEPKNTHTMGIILLNTRDVITCKSFPQAVRCCPEGGPQLLVDPNEWESERVMVRWGYGKGSSSLKKNPLHLYIMTHNMTLSTHRLTMAVTSNSSACGFLTIWIDKDKRIVILWFNPYYVSLAYLFCTLIKEGECSVLTVSKASLFDERREDLSVKEVRKEWPLPWWAVLLEQFLIKQ